MEGQTFKIFTVKDELTGKFLQPVFIETEAEAIRWFKFVLNKTELWKDNAAMYSLYMVGKFNDIKGIEEQKPELIQGGLSVLERSENA